MAIQTIVRKLAIKLLSVLGDRDIRIAHHWTRQPLWLNMFRHRGYWWKGRSRERETIEAIHRIISKGHTVVELGGHIGYFTQIFAHLAGPEGRVIVFEPSQANIRYLARNIVPFPNTSIVDKAVSNEIGTVTFYEEGLSGQNNSIVRDYDIFTHNRAAAGVEVSVTETTVPCTTLDQECAELKPAPDFIKIDVEGAELMALQGARATLNSARPVLMVEISNNIPECFALLKDCNYEVFRPDGGAVHVEPGITVFNIFAFPGERAATLKQVLAPVN